jgi:hypothetical protein
MSKTTAQSIHESVSKLAPGELFCTRHMLHFGTRSSVDVSLWRLVRDGTLVRFARGVFARPPNDEDQEPSPRAVAEMKAKAFGKTLVSDHADEAKELGLCTSRKKDIVFRVNGRSSQFLFNGKYIYLKASSKRKLQLGDSSLGKVLRALWFLGHETCEGSRPAIEAPLIKAAALTSRKIVAWIPSWLHKIVEEICPPALPIVQIPITT